MFKKSKIVIEFTVGISKAYPTKAGFLGEYLPSICANRDNYNMKSMAGDLDLSPSQLTQKLSELNNTTARWTSVDDDRLKRITSAEEYLPIIAYDIESTQREQNRIDQLEAELSELRGGE